MNLTIRDYNSDMDNDLLELFYKSNFYKRKEFDYVRIPDSWIYRYTLNTPYIVKVAFDGNTIIGSLGVVTRNCTEGGRNIRTGCFVDNCILPEYLNHYDEIFSNLFFEVEADARKEEMDIILGWTFLKHYEGHQKFWDKLEFTPRKGFNCFLGGSDFDYVYPHPPKLKLSKHWKLALAGYKYYHKLMVLLLKSVPENTTIRMMKKSDLNSVHKLLTKPYHDCELPSSYSLSDYENVLERNSIHCIVAERDSEIIGVLTFINTAWSGWMYGIPHYDTRWGVFYSFIIDEFIVKPKYQKTTIPANMILHLMKIKDPEKKVISGKDYTYVGGIVDREVEWMRKAFLKLGFSEPKFDYGVVLGKSLNDDVKLDTDKIWHLPTRYILAPVPKREELQQLETVT